MLTNRRYHHLDDRVPGILAFTPERVLVRILRHRFRPPERVARQPGAHVLQLRRRPQNVAKSVIRLDRLLSFLGTVPIKVALRKITKDGRDGVLPVVEADILEVFVRPCTNYDIEHGDIVSSRVLIADQTLTSLEKPVILALVEMSEGATLDELVAATDGEVSHPYYVEEVLTTCPLVVSLPDDRFALLDSSMYDQLVAEAEVTMPDISRFASALETIPGAGDIVDLSGIGTSGEVWWAMYAGPIPRRQLDGARERKQRYMSVLAPGTGTCLGMVRTSRVFNKYSAGIPTFLVDDKGLKGIELQRLVSRTQLRNALAEAPFVFYNDPSGTG